MFHLKAIEIISRSLRNAVANTPEGRADMALGQYVAGMGFSNVGLGIVHSMAHPLGALYDTPHLSLIHISRRLAAEKKKIAFLCQQKRQVCILIQMVISSRWKKNKYSGIVLIKMDLTDEMAGAADERFIKSSQRIQQKKILISVC